MLRANVLSFESFLESKNGFRFFYKIDNEPCSFFIALDKKKLNIDEDSKKNILFHIGLAFLIDLALIACPQKIILKIYRLSNDQLKFWNWLYAQASLERAYIEKEKLFYLKTKWLNTGSGPLPKIFKKKRLESVAISMSGGKESLTALKLFKKFDPIIFFFDYNDKNSFHIRIVQKELKKKFNFYQVNTNISHTRKLEKKFKVKDASISVIPQLIFNALLFSDKIDYFIIGNEYSSNFGNAEYLGKKANHQYDKTFLFAQKINAYLKKYFNGIMVYASPFFGMYEYKIAELFFKDKDYFNIWTSCNNSSSVHNFCCRCPKCAFVYIISSPFIKTDFLDKFFRINPLDNLKLCRQLIDIKSEKPIDCVGEKKECWVALNKLIEQKKNLNTKTVIYFQKNILPLIKEKITKMEAEINANQLPNPYLPKKLKACLPPSFRS